MMLWLSQHAWVMFAWCALALLTAAVTMVIQLRLTPIAPRHLYMRSVGALFAAVGVALGGMQAGPAPILPPAEVLPVIRLFWMLAATCLLAECVLYLTYTSAGRRGRRQSACMWQHTRPLLRRRVAASPSNGRAS